MSALTACQAAFLLVLPSSLATVYSLGLQSALLDKSSLNVPWLETYIERWNIAVVLCRSFGFFVIAHSPQNNRWRSSVCDRKQTRPAWVEEESRAGELGWRGDDEGGKGGGQGEKQTNVFSWGRERERERLRDCSGICFHFRKVLELMCISWLLTSACLRESERVRRSRGEN